LGLDINGIKLLLKAKKMDLNFEKVLTIGRQVIQMKERDLKDLMVKNGLSKEVVQDVLPENGFSEDFFKTLGATTVDSMDASNYESATIIHDLNQPISDDLKSKFSMVIDSGTLEHVFNFPTAIRSCMEMIQTGGYYIGITPANNFFGHGFYQFSPELFFRIFDKQNGFEVEKMYFYVDDLNGATYYEVSDPHDIKNRVTLINSQRSYLFVIARKLEETEIFKEIPFQSDYEHILWENKVYGVNSQARKAGGLSKIKGMVPLSAKVKVRSIITKLMNKYKVKTPRGISNREYIRSIPEEDKN
jgi:hypothetical protein